MEQLRDCEADDVNDEEQPKDAGVPLTKSRRLSKCTNSIDTRSTTQTVQVDIYSSENVGDAYTCAPPACSGCVSFPVHGRRRLLSAIIHI